MGLKRVWRFEDGLRRGLGDRDRGWWKGCGSGRQYNDAGADADIDVHAISTFSCISSYCDRV